MGKSTLGKWHKHASEINTSLFKTDALNKYKFY